MSTARRDVGMSTESPTVREQIDAVDESALLASSTATKNREQNDLLTTWRDFQETPIDPPERLLESLGPLREAFLSYLQAPDRDDYARGIALLDLCIERTLESALSLWDPGLGDQIRACLRLAVGAPTELEVRQGAAEALDLVTQGALAHRAWEATGRAVERRDRAVRETMRVRQSQGQVVTAAAAMDVLAKAVGAVAQHVPDNLRLEARRDLERALDDRSNELRAGLRWWIDSVFARSEASR